MLAMVLFPVAIAVAWYIGYRHSNTKLRLPPTFSLPRDYFLGLQYLIDEQPDKAVDVFVKLLEVNEDTVETHMALGGVFRRRGEVNRAIRIHQNLIARPQLNKNQRHQSLFELAQDYLHAGVLDRAEGLFLELTKSTKKNIDSFKSLLGIYEQQKEWQQAINIARKMGQIHNINMKPTIAHYYCELNNAKKALAADRSCVRANLLNGAELAKTGDFKAAIRVYYKIGRQSPDYLSEIVAPLAEWHSNLDTEKKLITYLQESLRSQPRVATILILAKLLHKYHSNFRATEFVAEQLRAYPSLRGLSCLVELYIDGSDEEMKDRLGYLRTVIDDLLREKPVYCCAQCGFSAKSLYWQCPACKRWGSIKPIHGLEGD